MPHIKIQNYILVRVGLISGKNALYEISPHGIPLDRALKIQYENYDGDAFALFEKLLDGNYRNKNINWPARIKRWYHAKH